MSYFITGNSVLTNKGYVEISQLYARYLSENIKILFLEAGEYVEKNILTFKKTRIRRYTETIISSIAGLQKISVTNINFLHRITQSYKSMNSISIGDEIKVLKKILNYNLSLNSDYKEVPFNAKIQERTQKNQQVFAFQLTVEGDKIIINDGIIAELVFENILEPEVFD